MLSREIISQDEEELYIYGLFMLISQTIFFILSCVLGLAFKCFFESIFFYLMFQSIRKYAGGYHANTETLCEIMSTFSIALCIAIIRCSNMYDISIFLLCASLISAVIILSICPLDTPEKPLTEKEFHYFRKIAMLILLLLSFLTIVSFVFKWKLLFAPASLSLILESILLIAGKIKKTIKT